jgi:hypothetical protein
MKKTIKEIFAQKNFLRITLPILLIIILAVIGFFSFHRPNTNLTPLQAENKTKVFVDKFLMQSGNKVTIEEVTTEYGLYKIKIGVTGSTVDSYLTKDGKLFFPQALDIDEITNEASADKDATPAASAPSTIVKNKTEKPVVELFVMSYCPFGTQIERGILPALNTLKNKIDFQLKFVDYAMHGTKELTENLTQYCIQKNEPEKLNNYINCFLENGDSSSCLDSNKINKNKIITCVSDTDKQYSINANANITEKSVFITTSVRLLISAPSAGSLSKCMNTEPKAANRFCPGSSFGVRIVSKLSFIINTHLLSVFVFFS